MECQFSHTDNTFNYSQMISLKVLSLNAAGSLFCKFTFLILGDYWVYNSQALYCTEITVSVYVREIFIADFRIFTVLKLHIMDYLPLKLKCTCKCISSIIESTKLPLNLF